MKALKNNNITKNGKPKKKDRSEISKILDEHRDKSRSNLKLDPKKDVYQSFLKNGRKA